MGWIEKNQWRITAVIQMGICLAAVALSVRRTGKRKRRK